MIKAGSIKNKILLPFLAMVILAIISIFLVSTMFSRQLEQELKKRMTSLHSLASSNFSQEGTHLELHTKIVAEALLLTSAIKQGHESIEKNLLSYAKKIKDFELHLAVFGERGEFLAATPEYFDLSDLSSFNLMVKRGFLEEAVVSTCQTSSGLVLCSVCPIKDATRLYGVVLAVSPLDKEFLEKVKTATGTDVVLYADNKLMASTLAKEKIFSLKIEKMSLEDKSEEFKIVGQEAFYTAPLRFKGENVGFLTVVRSLAAEETAFEQQQINVLIAIGGAILIIVILLTGTLITRSVTVPVEELVKATHRISRGDLTRRANVKAGGEIGELAESFNRMASSLEARTESLTKTLAELQSLYDVERAISLILNIDEAVEAILRISIRVLKAEYSVFRVVDEEGYLTTVATTHPRALRKVRVRIGDGVVGEVAQSGVPKLVEDLSLEPCSLCEEELAAQSSCRTVICAPLKIKNKVVGVLELINKTTGKVFLKEDLELLSLIASRAALALENARLFEETLEEKGKSEAILHSMEDGVIALNNKGEIILLNPSVEDLLDVKEKDVLNKHFLRVIKEESIKAIISKALEKKEPLGEEIELKGAFERIFQIRATPVETETKEVLGVVILIHDVTEIRKLERVKSDFVSTVSHELRTPLTSIKAYVATLLREDVKFERKVEREFLEIINHEADRLARLISDLLSVTRIESGRLALELEPVDLGLLVKEVVKTNLSTQTEKHEFILKIPEKLPLVLADEDKVRQIILNLGSNAIKYSPQSGSIKIEVKEAKEEVLVSFTDEGIGIPKEHLALIFDKFHRVDNEATREAGGVGLGLYVTKGIIDAHGGRIWVESEVNKGSTFTFALPKRRAYQA